MKTLVAIISFAFLSIGAFAQQQKTIAKLPVVKPATSVTYRCPVCGAESQKAGECAKDKVSYVKVGDYYCPDCYMTSAKPGKCTMCGVDMKKMETASAKK